MIEVMNKSLQATVLREVRKATQHLQASDIEDAAIGPDGMPPENTVGFTPANVTKLL